MTWQVNTKQPATRYLFRIFTFFYPITCGPEEREKLGAQKFQRCLTIRAMLETFYHTLPFI